MTRFAVGIVATALAAGSVHAQRVQPEAVERYVKTFRVASDTIVAVARRVGYADTMKGFPVIQSLRAYYDLVVPPARNKAAKRFDDAAAINIFRRDAELVNQFSAFSFELENFIREKRGSELAAFGLTAADTWPSLRDFRTANTSIAAALAAVRIERYKVRFGSGERLNYLEVQLDNLVTRYGLFGASSTSPSPVEPIARFTPILYSTGSKNITSGLEAGLNLYSFSGFLQRFNPIGISLVYADPRETRFMKFDGDLRFGAVLHVWRNELGWVKDASGKSHFLFTRNFSVLLGVM
jgi:hypothetical protein